ncbi:unnamed protein product [Prunus brigantina]
MAFFWPVDMTSAETFRIPFASIEKQTSTLATPLGAGGMPYMVNPPTQVIISSGELILSLENSTEDVRMVVTEGRENLVLLCGNFGVSWEHDGHTVFFTTFRPK